MLMTIERRRAPRVEILGEIQGQVIPLDEVVNLRDLSTTGCSIRTRTPLVVGEVYEFQLVSRTERVAVRGRVIHRRVSFKGDTTLYVLGVEFVGLHQTTSAWLQRFVDAGSPPVAVPERAGTAGV
jgi:hypothetical protein